MADDFSTETYSAFAGARRLFGLPLGRCAAQIGSLLARRGDAATIRRLEAELEVRTAQLRASRQALADGRSTFLQASAAARLGIWECSLPAQALTWTEGTYDLFDLPRGAALRRERILECYTDASLDILEATRSRALEQRTGFGLDAEIVTPHGNRRWIRVTASIECERGSPVRIFGIKQDITEEKLLADRMRYLADFDHMTGLANRGRFQDHVVRLCEPRRDTASPPVLLLVDLDGFKAVNDTYGHATGDECLKQASARLEAVCRDADLVARIGGDEFAVLLGPGLGRNAVEALANDIVLSMARPVELCGRSLAIGASVGIAVADGCTPSELFARADAALYAAKAAGRSTFRGFEPEMLRA